MKRFVIAGGNGLYSCVLWHPGIVLGAPSHPVGVKHFMEYFHGPHARRSFLGEDYDVLKLQLAAQDRGCGSKFSEGIQIHLNNSVVIINQVRVENVPTEAVGGDTDLLFIPAVVGEVMLTADAGGMYREEFENQLNKIDAFTEFRPRLIMDADSRHITGIIGFDIRRKPCSLITSSTTQVPESLLA